MQLRATALLLSLFCCRLIAYSQDSSAYKKLYNLPDKIFNRIAEKSQQLERRLDKQTERYLTRVERQEKKLKKKLQAIDSTAAQQLFGNITSRYNKLKDAKVSAPTYNAKLDSIQTLAKMLQQRPDVSALQLKNYETLLTSYSQLQYKLDNAAAIKQFLKERQQYLKTHLQQFGLTKQFRQFQKEVYYYREQVDEYRRLLDDSSKLEAKLLQLANKVPAFRDFFSRNSLLAAMFPPPVTNPANPLAQLAGLQTRASIQQLVEQRFGTGVNISLAMQQQVQHAQTQLDQLKHRVSQLGQNGSDLDIPNFKPNSQKSKTFWNRIELGANMQSTKANRYFPVTSDIAVTAGYKLNDNSVAGLGLSYKLGWGQNIRNIRLSHEGIGLRSFADVKLKGSFYVTGGFEYNYQKPFNSVSQLQLLDNWQQCGLIGVSKIVSIQTKFLKKTKLQLLWDFLSYEQMPRTQPLKFRVGYGF